MSPGGTLPLTPGAETGLTPSQFARMKGLVSSTRSLAGSAECTTFPTFYEAFMLKGTSDGSLCTHLYSLLFFSSNQSSTAVLRLTPMGSSPSVPRLRSRRTLRCQRGMRSLRLKLRAPKRSAFYAMTTPRGLKTR